MIESVEHQLFLCRNATRVWNLFYRSTGINIGSLFEILICTANVEIEIIKSIMIKTLLQIDRSQNRSEREILAECAFYLGVEAMVNKKLEVRLKECAGRLLSI